MKKMLLLIACLCVTLCAFSQVPTPAYYDLVHTADSLLKAKSFRPAAYTYTQAFKAFKGRGLSNDRYKAACAWALSKGVDSAFSNLERIANKADYKDYEQVTTDVCLFSLHKDPRWEPLVKQVLKNKEKFEFAWNKPLVVWLDSLATEDQKWKRLMIAVLNKETDTISLSKINARVMFTDSLHYLDLKAIVAKVGFPNTELVGAQGANNFWLLVQHQDAHPDFQQQILTLMKQDVDAKKASPVDYAFLLDRVKVNTGQKQVYGTQMRLNSDSTSYQPKPVIDPAKLNKRRKDNGMESIEQYTHTMNMRHYGELKK